MNKFEEWVSKRVVLPSVTTPGGYPVFYIDKGANVYCAKCASKVPEDIIAHDVHWEGPAMWCDTCNEQIESAYGEVDEDLYTCDKCGSEVSEDEYSNNSGYCNSCDQIRRG